jgi:biopolymer transport protein ExbB
MSFLEFISNNLIHVLPILLIGAFGVAIIAERVAALYRYYPIQDLEEFFKRISTLVTSGKIGDAIQYCDQFSKKPLANVVRTALSRCNLPESVIEDGLHMAVSNATQTIQKRTSFLAMIANVATLLGLLGTILGLIHSFEAVGHADAQQKSALLSAGIATAMNATMLGLGVAIPCMIAFSLLVNRSNFLIAQVENASVQTLDILKQRFYSDEFPEEQTEKLNASSKSKNREVA